MRALVKISVRSGVPDRWHLVLITPCERDQWMGQKRLNLLYLDRGRHGGAVAVDDGVHLLIEVEEYFCMPFESEMIKDA